MIRVFFPVLSTTSRLRLPAISHYIYVGLAAIAISHLNSYLQPHHSPMASTEPTLIYPEAEVLLSNDPLFLQNCFCKKLFSISYSNSNTFHVESIVRLKNMQNILVNAFFILNGKMVNSLNS